MPYQSYTSAKQTLENAKYLMQAGAQMVKFEGGREHESAFKILQDNHIPVCGHLGLQPQAVLEMGGYKVQGRSEDDAQRILENARALEGWGVKTIVLECIPAKLGKKISTRRGEQVVSLRSFVHLGYPIQYSQIRIPLIGK
jgi:3-methyl-2-oxobutanoate hydroxymethyltransferase